MGRGILRGAGGDENLKFNFIWPYDKVLNTSCPFMCLADKKEVQGNMLPFSSPIISEKGFLLYIWNCCGDEQLNQFNF